MLAPTARFFFRRNPVFGTLQSRHLSTAPSYQRSRSWRNSAVRWGIAIGGLYYYNTSSVFAEEPPFSPSLAHPTTPDETSYPTLDSTAPSRIRSSPSTSTKASSISDKASGAFDNPRPAGLEEVEEEAHQEGAYNEETGEINWDCPCLGGMAHGPCGEQFREAFSCFVYSKEEPKGMDCIDRFRGMQDCFRLHPDVYGDELADPGPSEDDEPAIADAVNAAVEGIAEDAPASIVPAFSSSNPSSSSVTPPQTGESESDSNSRTPPPATLTSATPSDAHIHPSNTTNDDDAAKAERAKRATEQVKKDHETAGEEELVPKEWHDTRSRNDAK